MRACGSRAHERGEQEGAGRILMETGRLEVKREVEAGGGGRESKNRRDESERILGVPREGTDEGGGCGD
jgi:hypothetical protein